MFYFYEDGKGLFSDIECGEKFLVKHNLYKMYNRNTWVRVPDGVLYDLEKNSTLLVMATSMKSVVPSYYRIVLFKSFDQYGVASEEGCSSILLPEVNYMLREGMLEKIL